MEYNMYFYTVESQDSTGCAILGYFATMNHAEDFIKSLAFKHKCFYDEHSKTFTFLNQLFYIGGRYKNIISPLEGGE